MSNTPYTYLIGWSKLNTWYYGVRWANKVEPVKDLWTKYFTTSKRVKQFREYNGEPDVIQVRRVFSDFQIARKWEHTVLRRMNVVKDPKWLNQTDNIAIFNDEETRKFIGRKAKVWMTGKIRSQSWCDNISKSKVGVTPNISVEGRIKIVAVTHTKESNAKRVKNITEGIWIKKDGKSKRLAKDVDIPDGWERGRIMPETEARTKAYKLSGYNYGIKNKGMVSAYDLQNQTNCHVTKEEFHSNPERYCGISSTRNPTRTIFTRSS